MKKFFLFCLFGVVLVAPGLAWSDLDSGLVAYYTFEGNANDQSGNGNDGTVHGSVDYVSGIAGQAAHIDSTDEYISIWDTEGVNNNINTSDGSISVWIKIDERYSGKSSFVFQYFSSHQDRLYLDAGDWHDSGKKLNIGVGASRFWTSGTVPDGEWHHVVVTWSASGTINVFIDGEFDTEDTFNNPDFSFQGEEFFYLGRGWAGNPGKFSGSIDNLRIYNRSLTSLEVKQLYNRATGGDGNYSEADLHHARSEGYWEGYNRALEEMSGCATFNDSNSTLHIPCFSFGAATYWLDLRLISTSPVHLELTDFGEN